MKHFCQYPLVLVLAVLVHASAETTLWPLPAAVTSGNQTVTVISPAPPGSFFLSTYLTPFLEAAFTRYTPLVFPHAVQPLASRSEGVYGLFIYVADSEDFHPQLETDESYTLEVPVPGIDGAAIAIAHARTVYGALRALETFSQLVKFDFDQGTYKIEGAPWKIADQPRFLHRGLMVDTGRHFLSLAALRAIIDTLPFAKLNVFHWHMVDTQSFPFQSTSSPKLWNGAYSPLERYTQADVRSIVEYARLRGVRVMVEFDMPGHAQSWCVGYPEICPSPTCTTPLNVASNATFDVIQTLLAELTGEEPLSGLFPESFIHLGGDEVDTSCWTNTSTIASWLEAHNMSADDAYAYFTEQVAKIAIDQGRRPVQWSEVYDHFKTKLPKQTVVHVWKTVTNVTEVVASGYNVIRNVGYDNTSWYLDNLDVDWSAAYQNEPCEGIPTEELCRRVLGGHGEMWGETVDGSDLQQTVWPRLAAVAEKLWSGRAQTQDVAAALPRIRDFRCLLLERGVAAAPVDNHHARSAPAGPDSCYRQHGSAGQAPTLMEILI